MGGVVHRNRAAGEDESKRTRKTARTPGAANVKWLDKRTGYAGVWERRVARLHRCGAAVFGISTGGTPPFWLLGAWAGLDFWVRRGKRRMDFCAGYDCGVR